MKHLFAAFARVARAGQPAPRGSTGRGLVLAAGLLAAGLAPAAAQSVTLAGPAGSGLFGSRVAVLPNGNFVVTDPGYDLGAAANAGAVYLYNGSTRALISTLTGATAGDQVGSGGVTVLATGHYVVSSPEWSAAGAAAAGAATWCSGTAGLAGSVSAANSLVGSRAADRVSNAGIVALPNGHYVVRSYQWSGTGFSAGAVTWGHGATGAKGAVGAANSLVGSRAGDRVGSDGTATFPNGITVLPSGHYLVRSPRWNGGFGAVTWGSGTAGVALLTSRPTTGNKEAPTIMKVVKRWEKAR